MEIQYKDERCVVCVCSFYRNVLICVSILDLWHHRIMTSLLSVKRCLEEKIRNKIPTCGEANRLKMGMKHVGTCRYRKTINDGVVEWCLFCDSSQWHHLSSTRSHSFSVKSFLQHQFGWCQKINSGNFAVYDDHKWDMKTDRPERNVFCVKWDHPRIPTLVGKSCKAHFRTRFWTRGLVWGWVLTASRLTL